MIPLVYNPASGHGEGTKRMETARSLFRRHDIEVDPVPTTAPGAASELTASLARDHDTIYVVGGDGTLSEAADGVLSAGLQDDVALGFLPGGTGNDFLRDFTMEPIAVAADRIAQGNERRIDAAHVTWPGGSRHSINVFGTGFVADVCDFANRRLKWMGQASYTAAVYPVLAALRSPETRITIDDEETIEGRFPMVAVCNSVHTGGDMIIAPMAQQDDGLLDFICLKQIGRIGLIRLFPKIFDGTHIEDDRVLHRKVRKVQIEPSRQGPLLGDGEVYGSTPVTIEVMPGALRLLL